MGTLSEKLGPWAWLMTICLAASISPPLMQALGPHFDGDGDLDLAVANLDGNTTSVFLNDGGGGFSTRSVYSTGRWPSTVTFADVDGDGTCEVLVTGTSRSLSLLFSDRLR